jgi:hypothetical protein
VIGIGERLPLADASVDLIVSDSTFEHIAVLLWLPASLIASSSLEEGSARALRIFWGYIGVGANLVPNRRHVPWLKILQPHRRAAIRHHFSPEAYAH